MNEVYLLDAESKLKQMDEGGRSIKDCFTDIYITVSGQDVRPEGGFIGKFVLATDPVFPASAALMVEDVLESAFQNIAVDKQRWRIINHLMSSDEHVVLASLIDVLLGVVGSLPIAVVSALLLKIGAKKAFAIDAKGPQFDKSLFGKLASSVLGTESCDQFEINLHAARLHRAAGKKELCLKRLANCETLCRQRDDLPNLNSVGYEYIELGDRHKGDMLLEEVLSAAPNDPGLMDSIAWSHYKAGRMGKAVELIKKVLDREEQVIGEYTMEGMKEVLYHAVSIFRAIGESQMASDLYKRLASLDASQKWIPLLESGEQNSSA